MPNEERMALNERRKYLRLIKKRYLKASKCERVDNCRCIGRSSADSMVWSSGLARSLRSVRISSSISSRFHFSPARVSDLTASALPESS